MGTADLSVTDAGASKHIHGFTSRLMSAMPRWAVGCLSVFLGMVMTMVIAIQFLGVSGQFHRVVDAYVIRIEQSSKSIDVSIALLEKVAARIESIEQKLVNQLSEHVQLVERVTRMETRAASSKSPPDKPKKKAEQPKVKPVAWSWP